MNQLLSTETITMSSREIAELVEKEHRNVMRDIRVMLVELHGEGGVLKFEHTLTNEQNGQTYPVFKLPKRETLILVSGYSVTLRARIIDRWQELEDQVSKPAPTIQYSPKDVVEFADALARSLNVEGSGKLNMLRVSLETTGHKSLITLLPAYAVDAPDGSAAVSSSTTAALTTLLKRHGLNLSAAKVNKMLAAAGLLEEEKRPSSKTPEVSRKFWSITQAGLAFGKNVTNEKNQLETQPHWYESKFPELCEKLGLELAK